ncbi:hypothetical protein like AT3G15040 [Hibiscus trionum]|uniref:Senescence regulator n=1 Tax=Hibiscus trionum TaxID=183268 RepID=A0A9W7I5M3_HIBTR|nr:hypothetical protein like AT3G15040 [Hibiscus trionum]
MNNPTRSTSTTEFSVPSRFRHAKSPSTDRFLGVYPHAPPSDHPSSSSAIGEELNEDDIFFSDNNSDCSNSSGSLHNSLQRTISLSSSPLNHKPFPLSENFGILAAIRDSARPSSHFFQKPSISSSPSSSSSAISATSSASRPIPSIPKPPQERVPIVASPSSSLGIYHQSAPVNVPILAKTMRKNREFDDDLELDVEEEGEVLPPHEMVARSSAQSPMLACSVLEGVGRTLKGRDLRKVRNAIWRQTGFLD